jgi:hypothetical protein
MHLVHQYDLRNSNEVKIVDFITDIKDYVYEDGPRMQLMRALLNSNKPTGHNGHNAGRIGSESNTKSERLNLSNGPKIQCKPEYFEDLAKATSVREETVQEYFTHFAQNQNGGILQIEDFKRAVFELGIQWPVSQS